MGSIWLKIGIVWQRLVKVSRIEFQQNLGHDVRDTRKSAFKTLFEPGVIMGQ
jgi:hypothetical protein